MNQEILIYAFFPALAVLLGGLGTLWRPMMPTTLSGVQHFAAGVLFCALATELLPDLLHRKMPWVTLIGFSLGCLFMLTIKHFTEQYAKNGLSSDEQPNSLVIVSGIDIAFDGLLIGLGFTAGQKQGVLLTIALSMELFFLGLSCAAALRRSHVKNSVLLKTIGSFSFLVLVGAWLGAKLFIGVSDILLDAVLAFALAALLYLVTEELLVEAHEIPETNIQTAMFFVGFILLLTIEMYL